MRNPRKKNGLFWFVLFLIILLPLITAQAQEGIFNENFSDPSLPGWEISKGVSAADGFMHLEPEALAARADSWENFQFLSRLRWYGRGQGQIFYRTGNAGKYILIFDESSIQVQKQTYGEIVVLEISSGIEIPSETWIELEIITSGSGHLVKINGETLLEFTDEDPLPPGGFGFNPVGQAVLDLDQIIIESTGGESQPAAEPPIADQSGEPLPIAQLEWIYTGGPPGGLGYDIRYNFADPNIWYVTDSFAGVFRSMDRGITWQDSSAGIGSRVGVSGSLVPIFSLTVDPHQPSIVWAGTQNTGHIYKSTDYGETWVEKDHGTSTVYPAVSFRGFTVDPRSSEIVYAMAESASIDEQTGGLIFRTRNGGEHWEMIWDGGMPSALARYMWIDPTNPDILYVSTGIFDRKAVGPEPYSDVTSGLGILKSTDGGESWNVLDRSNGLELLHIGSLYMDPENPRVLLAAAGHVFNQADLQKVESSGENPAGVFRTTDGGESWVKVLVPNRFKPAEVFSSVEICPSDHKIAYAASQDTVYRSEDAGINWQPASTEFGWGPPGVLAGFPIDIQCDPTDPDRLFINNYGGGNFLSEDGGKTWINASQGYTGAQIISMAVDPQHAGRIFVTGSNSGIWGSHDGGSSWVGLRPENTGIFQNGLGAVAVDPQDQDHLISGGKTGFVILDTHDSGDNWQRLWSLDEKGIEFEAREGSMPTEVFMDVAVPTCIEFAPSDPDIVYLGGLFRAPFDPFIDGVGVFISRDNGKTWIQTADEHMQTLSPYSLAVDPVKAEIVYAGTGEGLYKSTDGGDTWQNFGNPDGTGQVFAVAVNPQDPDHIIYGVKNHGVFVTHDAGISWTHGVAGWEPNGIPTDIIIHPQMPDTVFMSDFLSGVYYSENGGTAWQKINQGLRMLSVLDLELSADGGHLYAGSQGAGVLRMDLYGTPPPVAEPLISTAAPFIGEGAPADEQEGEDPAVSEEVNEDKQTELEQEEPSQAEQPGLPCFGAVLPLSLIAIFYFYKRRS